MARRVFFSFHYERDIWRANVVRNSWVTQPDREAAGFWDASLWEEARRRGDDAVRRMIDEGIRNTSVTAVLVGAKTAQRRWVRYEIEESHKRRNGILAVHINSIRDRNGHTDAQGANPLGQVYVRQDGRRVPLSELYRTYDWVWNHGYTGFAMWVDAVAYAAGR